MLGLVTLSAHAHAQSSQYIETYLPRLLPGFDQQQGVSVLSRVRPLYQDEGVHMGSFVVRGGLDEKFGYDSNITGSQNAPSSPFIETNPSVTAQSNWSRNSLGLSATLDNYNYFSAPRESHTNYTAAVGGTLNFMRDTLDLGYAHEHNNEFGTDAGAVAFNAPVPFDVDILRAAYTFDLGRLKFIPNADFRVYQFSNNPIPNQSFRDRTVLSGGLTTRYELSTQRALVLVIQGVSSHYIRPQRGVPSLNSTSVLVLPGIDYQAGGPWRYQLLIGGEVRSFEAPEYATQAAPVFEGSVIYSPTGLTTLTATLRREIQDTSAESSSSYTYTGLGFVIDHEYRRNVLLQGSASFRAVDYKQGLGNSTAFAFGGGVTWLIDQHLSAYATYNFTHQDGSATRAVVNDIVTSNVLQPSFTQNLALVGLRWRL